ncbi:MAG TPA: prenyltransferase/squalene oxidase repeat-containing protein [Abditibacteriaceae bacterium]|jgi:squalene-hopene/tetraprenyl-beta-curcumene cyclase
MSAASLSIDEATNNAIRALLHCRVEGHWVGELSSSALSTATAILALKLAQKKRPVETDENLIQRGAQWLLQTQNSDGGWGDTTLSLSNISTTALCWASLSVAGDARECASSIHAAEEWLSNAAGGLQPEQLVEAISARYGKDRTFSVPILTVLAIAGKLGPGREGWRRVPQLPFEVAACPHQWFKWLSLPVVSYALPALIAIGQARHHQAPTRNPFALCTRRLARRRTLRVLQSIQPSSGGFLEATPLTSFVAMSLIVSGNAKHDVVKAGLDFLRYSARSDGSWPIDTDLATWTTTLAVNALGQHANFDEILPHDERRAIHDWLLAQQYREEHPYTHAAPGGWAWTDLPGGVPDADDTPGALLALHHLGIRDGQTLQAVQAGITWLLDLQNRDGGMPTFCKGWGTLPFDRSGADLTAHALLSWRIWQEDLPEDLSQRVVHGIERGLQYLSNMQGSDGAWTPLWFGNQHASGDENPTYGTARVLIALSALQDELASQMRRRGLEWLLAVQNPDGGWGGDKGVTSSIEETGLALSALSAFLDEPECKERIRTAREQGIYWLVQHTDNGKEFQPSPIGFYFAKLWYSEQLYPLIFSVGALSK